MKDLGYGEGYQLAHYHADKLTTIRPCRTTSSAGNTTSRRKKTSNSVSKRGWNKSSAGKQNIRAGWAPLLGLPSGTC